MFLPTRTLSQDFQISSGRAPFDLGLFIQKEITKPNYHIALLCIFFMEREQNEFP